MQVGATRGAVLAARRRGVTAGRFARPSGVAALLERAFCCFAISVFMGAYVSVPLKLAGTSLASGEANPFSTACQTAILLGLAVLCARRWRRVAFVVVQSRALLLFMLLAAASLAWSAAPDLTLRRVVTLGSTVGFAWYACASFPMERMIRMIAACALVSAVASAAAALALPAVGVMTEGDLAGAWNGVYAHKNPLGWMMILGCLSYGWLWAQTPQRRVRYGLYIVFCFAVAVMSRSRTAQLMILLLPVVACGIGVAKLGGLSRFWAVYLLIVGGAVAAVLGWLFFADVMTALGKDPTLTGRVPLWSFLLGDVAERPMLGYGYGAYFLDVSAHLQWIRRLVDWSAPEAHEGYIELLLQLGIPGLALGVWLLLSTARMALSRPLRDELPWASYAAVYAICYLAINFIDTMLMNPGDIQSMILPMLYAGLRSELAQRRIAGPRARGFAARAR